MTLRRSVTRVTDRTIMADDGMSSSNHQDSWLWTGLSYFFVDRETI